MIGRMILAAAAIGFAVPAAAATPRSGLEAIGTPLDDAQLDAQRGKFVSPDQISFFGVELATLWVKPDGTATAATVMLNVSFAQGAGTLAGAAPQLMVSWTRDGDSSIDVPSSGLGTSLSLPAGSGALDSVQGAVQSQQIAGSDNRVANAMQITIAPASSMSAPSTNGMTPLAGSQSHAFGNGDVLQFVAQDNKVGIVMTSAAGDRVRQQVDGSLGQAAQNVILSSDGNRIGNMMGITVGYSASPSATAMTLQNSLMSLKGIGF